MMRIWDFVADLARAGKGYLEIKEMVETVYGEKVSRQHQFTPSSKR
jgi:hypothetical protein